MDTSINYTEFLDDTEQEVSESHPKLLEAVSGLDKGQRIKKATRNEPILEVSEFHLVKSGIYNQDAVQIHDLAKALIKKGHHLEITKTLQAAEKKVHVLPKPLEKPAADRIKRIVGFEDTKQELKKWNAIIMKNRVSESLHFPLNQSSMELKPSTEFVKRFRLQSDLEKELVALQPQKENIERKDDEFSLTMKEIIIKRKEAARIRAQQSYKEAKARRQNKIKSKKFHHIQKKEKIKLQLKEFEQLQKTDPKAALKKLEQLDKTRAEERMSLKHKNTGKWAKSKQIRAKYDKEARQELAQQLSVSRELTQKLKKISDTEEEDENDSTSVQPLANDKENPWIGNTKSESEIDEFVKSYRKYWNNQIDQSKNKKVDVNIKSTRENKQANNLLKDAKFDNILSDKNTDVEIDSFVIQNNKKSLQTPNVNMQVISSDLKSQFNLKDDNITCNIHPIKITSYQKTLTAKESKSGNIKNNSYDKITQETVLDSNKKAKSHRTNNNVTATSTWNVESIENINVKNVLNSLTFNTSNKEKINKIFDFMEENVQDQIKSKLERVTQSYNKVKVNKKRKNKNIFEEDHFDGLEIQARRRKPILDSGLNETVNENNSELNIDLKKVKHLKCVTIQELNTSKVEIDPNKYINIKPKHLNTDFPVDITSGNDILDDSEGEEKRNVVTEAFADDDVVEEFRKEKKEEMKKSRPKTIDLTLPGWGSWGGKDIKISKRKKKRFILKTPKDLSHKDENKGNVIIIEEGNPKIKEHQVNELPYPFSSVRDYEASVRMPIGRNFVPENSHRKLIEPTIKTDMGKIIEPMNVNILVKKEKNKRRKFVPKKNIIFKKQKVKGNKNIIKKVL